MPREPCEAPQLMGEHKIVYLTARFLILETQDPVLFRNIMA